MKNTNSKPKCYLVFGEEWYEPHDFSYAKVFLNKKDADKYVKEVLSRGMRCPNTNKKGYSGYPEIIKLDFQH